MIKDVARAIVGSVPALQEGLVAVRRRRLHRRYEATREDYHRRAAARGLRYGVEAARAELRRRLASRGCAPVRKAVGDVHTFAFIPRISWHQALYDALSALGPVAAYDYIERGARYADLVAPGSAGNVQRERVNAGVLPALLAAHQKRPVDWVFVYATGAEIMSGTVEAIQREVGLPCVTMCLDDKNSWEGPRYPHHRGGQIDIARCFDLSWTSARVACEWYLVEGGNPVYLPEGCDPALYRPLDAPRDVPVSFVGSLYGRRARVVRLLRRCGVPLQAFGEGPGTTFLQESDKVRLFNRSVINLGLGWASHSDAITNVKGRDFEIPCTGGGVYLTTYNADLAQHFDIGREILCYGNDFELVELIRHYLVRPEEAAAIARAGRQRCLREHTWRHRFETILKMAEIL